MKLVLAALISLSSVTPALARGEFQPGYSSSRTCTRNEYREEYVPGTQNSPGYVRNWTETVEVPCNSRAFSTVRPAQPQPSQPQKVDTNDCSEGTLIGGLLGAGLATTGSRGKDRWWAIPAGGAAGAMLGCQIDGG